MPQPRRALLSFAKALIHYETEPTHKEDLDGAEQ
jgi:hypothetical protein